VSTQKALDNLYYVNITLAPVSLRAVIYQTPISNIRFVPVDKLSTFNTTDVFQNQFLDILRGVPDNSTVAPFTLLRVCGMTGENFGAESYNPTEINYWSNRTLPTDSTQVDSQYGIAVEYVV
jgi:hypothetical protein